MSNHDHLSNELGEHGLRLDNIESTITTLATKEDIENIVRNTMVDVLFKAGRGTKAVIITLAVIFGSVAVIGGGFKWLLGFIGFTYMK